MAKISRKELLKKPDEFISFSAKAILFTKEHSKQFSNIGIAIVCIILIYLAFNTYQKYVNKKGQNAYNLAYIEMTKKATSEMTPEELKQVQTLFSEVTDKYGSSSAARLAYPELAYIHYLDKKYDEAISEYGLFLEELSESEPYIPLVKMAIAVCYEGKGEYNEAIQVLEQVNSSSDDFFKEQVMLGLARLYRLTNNQEKSDNILKDFIDRFQNSPFLSLAKAHLNS